MRLVSSRTYQELSSNGLDLAELEPKPVDHRQIPIDPVVYTFRINTILLAASGFLLIIERRLLAELQPFTQMIIKLPLLCLVACRTAALVPPATPNRGRLPLAIRHAGTAAGEGISSSNTSGVLSKYPIIAKSASMGLTYGLADMAAQAFVWAVDGDAVPLADRVRRAIGLVAVGLFAVGPLLTVWFNFIDRLVPGKSKRAVLRSVFAPGAHTL
jgi:hypothetical protein